MKKVISVLLSMCLLFSVLPLNTYAETEKRPITDSGKFGLADETDLQSRISGNSEPDTSSLSEKIEEHSSENTFTEAKNDEIDASIKCKELSEKASLFGKKYLLNSEDDSYSLFAVSYYSGTTIPTYTYVTGRSLYDTYYSNDGEYVFYDYILYDTDDVIEYGDYLVYYDGWEFVSSTTADDSSYITFYFVKNGILVSVSANVRYDIVTVLFKKPANVDPTSVSLDISSRTMVVGNQYSLEATVYPSNATNKSITWSSSNSSIASVSSAGVVTAKAAGTATITAKTSNNKKATCTIKVNSLNVAYYTDTIIPTFTSITGVSQLRMVPDDTTIAYEYPFDFEFHTDYEAYLVIKDGWKILDEVTADDNSYFYAMYQKNDVIIMVMADFEARKTVVIYSRDAITVNPTAVSLDISSRKMVVGNMYTFTATVSPSNGNKSITWISSNPSVASVSSDGTITALKKGTAIITAKTVNNLRATCTITVSDFVRENYRGTIIPTFESVTGVKHINKIVTDVMMAYEYPLDGEFHTDYEAYLVNKDGWSCLDEEMAEDNSYFSATYAKNNIALVVYADFEYGLTTIIFENTEPYTSVDYSNSEFDVSPLRVPECSTIYFACYNGSRLVYIEPYTYWGEDTVSFTPDTGTYDRVKIMVADGSNSLNPLCTSTDISFD